MKAKLLRRLRYGTMLLHVPSTSEFKEYWVVKNSNQEDEDGFIFYFYKQALSFYLTKTHRCMRLYLIKAKKQTKQLMP